jgi:hypothetical protein
MQPAQAIQANDTAPLQIGALYGGGYYGGSIAIDGKTYAVIVAPEAEGQKILAWKNDWSATPGTLSVNDGFTNSEAMNNAEHPAAHFCRSLKIGGFDDWYLPSRDELELLYRNLKPTTDENYVYANRAKWWGMKAGEYNGVDESGNGHNASSVPAGDVYTEQTPRQTTAADLQDGAPEAFDDRWYWSSTEFGSAGAWGQFFDVGYQGYGYKVLDGRCRAVRKVLI